MLGLGACERCAETLELIDRQGLLDHREKHPLFETDVALEALAELAQLGRIGINARLQVLPTAADVDVLCQNAHDRRLVDLAVPSESRQQQLLLGSEMSRALPFEKVEKDRARVGRRLLPGALELERREQTLMVLVR